jgi:hypothetical protein
VPPGTGEVSNAPPVGECHALGSIYCGRAILAFLAQPEITAYRAWAAAKSLAPPSKARLRLVRDRGFDLGLPLFAEPRLPIAFPVHLQDTAIAAVAIEGSVFAPERHAPAESPSEWRAIIAEIEALARKNPLSSPAPSPTSIPMESRFSARWPPARCLIGRSGRAKMQALGSFGQGRFSP